MGKKSPDILLLVNFDTERRMVEWGMLGVINFWMSLTEKEK